PTNATDSASHHSFTSLFLYTNTAPSCIYTLSLHDALPILPGDADELRVTVPDTSGANLVFEFDGQIDQGAWALVQLLDAHTRQKDRKSTRLNSSHRTISYAVFCLKKKKN